LALFAFTSQSVSLPVSQVSQQICQPQRQRALDICMGLLEMFTLGIFPHFQEVQARISFKLN